MKRFLSLAASAICLALWLAACGGGTTQVDAFVPNRLLAFGDEHSSFAAGARKYSINALDAAGKVVDCEANPLWIQYVAGLYGFKFSECLGSATEAKALTRATYGATVADLTLQVDAQKAAGLASKDLALVLVGLHDIRQIYEGRQAGESEDSLIAKARQHGVDYAVQVNRLVELGAKVIVVSAPDLGITPYGLGKGASEAALLTRLSAAFNGRMRVNILNDGRYIGLVLADELMQSAAQVPAAYGLVNVTATACRSSALLPNCDNNTASLADGVTQDGWLWADGLHIGPTLHRQLGAVAGARAQSNPF